MKPSHSITGSHHEFVKADPRDLEKPSGYIEKEYEHQEYPKQVGDKVVNSAEEEAALESEGADPVATE